MAISKILTIKDCGTSYAGKHLRQALNYIMKQEKTGNGTWIAAVHCQKETAYEQMRQTKELFGKTDKRQGYHLILSFAEGEVSAETAFEIIGKFVKEYLGNRYETVYTVHDNTAHIHGHILFNSVSFLDGRKYRYEKGDWAKKIQPITNRLCEAYGLSTIEITRENAKTSKQYKEWEDTNKGTWIWADKIKKDLDACILQAVTYESFLSQLEKLGYEIKNVDRKEGRYLAIKPMGMARFRRCKSLGEDYTEERIRERILTENLSHSYQAKKEIAPKLVTSRIKQYQKTKDIPIKKWYVARIYHIQQLKQRAYSQVWKYREEIRNFQKLQEEYQFLCRQEIHSYTDILAVKETLAEKKQKISKEKNQKLKEYTKLKPYFAIAKEREKLEECEHCYQRGETLFEKEHKRWQELGKCLQEKGYSFKQIKELKEKYQQELSFLWEKEKAIAKEERIAKRIVEELCFKEQQTRNEKKEESREKENNKNSKNKESKQQPFR